MFSGQRSSLHRGIVMCDVQWEHILGEVLTCSFIVIWPPKFISWYLHHLYCQHGVCYGMKLRHNVNLQKFRSRSFFTRFPQPPRVIVYDNGCKLHVYCLNREPGYFQNTLYILSETMQEEKGTKSGIKLTLFSTKSGSRTQLKKSLNHPIEFEL